MLVLGVILFPVKSHAVVETGQSLGPGVICPGETTLVSTTSTSASLDCLSISKTHEGGWLVSRGGGAAEGPFDSVYKVLFGAGHRLALFTLVNCSKSGASERCDQSVLLNGDAVPYPYVQELAFSRDGNHMAYVAGARCLSQPRRGPCAILEKPTLVVDGQELETFEDVRSLVFSPDGKRLGFTVGRNCSVARNEAGLAPHRNCAALVNEIDRSGHGTYEAIEPVIFSFDSQHWAFWARRSTRAELVSDLRIIPLPIQDTSDIHPLVFTEDSRSLSYKGEHLLLDFSAVPETFSRAYTGTIGSTLKVQIQLYRNGSDLTGNFPKSRKPAVRLKGHIDSDGRFLMQEMTTQGDALGLLKGDFVREPTLTGVWSLPDGSGEALFQLFEKSEGKR